MPQYQSITLTSAISQLSSRLNDSANVYYTQNECQNSIIESLRWLQSLTGFYRERNTFKTSANVIFYDMRFAMDTPATGYPYAFTVTDNQLLSEIQAHLIEQIANPQTVLLQFGVTAISQALQRNRDQFLSDTGSYITRTLPFSGMPSNGRIQLPLTLIDVRRAAWKDSSSNKTYRLKRTDEYGASGYRPSWAQRPGLPFAYSVAVTPPVSLQVIPAPINLGTLDLCSLDTGPALPCNPSNPVKIGLMDDYCWGVKYGAMADLLGEDGPNVDLGRSQYCRTLYNLARSQAVKPLSSMIMQINDVETPIQTIEQYDSYRTSWQNVTAQTPTDIIQVSPNLIAVSPQPDTTYSISQDMVRSMPIPQSGSDFLQISNDMLEPVLDLSQHIISFKQGGQEFQSTIPLRGNFLHMAGLMNNRLNANIFFRLLLDQPASRPELDMPRLLQPEPTSA